MAYETDNEFLNQLFAHGLLIPSPVLGIYGRSGLFEEIVQKLEDAITSIGRDQATEVMRFPPVISREKTVQSGYLNSFPHLLGSVHAFQGKHRDHQALLQAVETQQEWGQYFIPTEVVMTPAACYPVYAAVTGTLPAGGRHVDVSSYCFRHEPSLDPARMQSFRMREFVRIGEPATVQVWREQWQDKGLNFLRALGLQPIHAPANDPFFGPGGRFLAASQQEQNLKFELLAAVSEETPTTAVMSLNYHQDHFGHDFHIHTADGEVAHTACVGFGLERITLALFRAHGFAVETWPADVRGRLWG